MGMATTLGFRSFQNMGSKAVTNKTFVDHAGLT